MSNVRHPLNDFLDQQEQEEARLAAKRASEAARRKADREHVAAKWKTVEQILNEAIAEMNALLAGRQRAEQFLYVPNPQPWTDVAKGIIRVAVPNMPPKIEVHLSVTTNGNVMLVHAFMEKGSIDFALGTATRSYWAEILTYIYKLVLSRC